MSKRSNLLANFVIRTRSLTVAVFLLLLLSPLAALSQSPGDISVTIEDYLNVPIGHYIDIEISFENASDSGLGGFDLYIEYDASAMILMDAWQGQLLTDCAWEYFQFQVRNDGPGFVRITSMADLNNGEQHPDCFLQNASGTLAVLKFYVSHSHIIECQSFPVQFIWNDCGTNAFSDRYGDSLLVSRYVYDWLNHDPIHQDDVFPTYNGAPDDCIQGVVRRTVDFTSGLVEIECGTPDPRGDLNLNNVAYEVDDYLLYIQYFFFGLGVFDINLEGQIANSDVNGDGQPLTFADLIYLYRVMIGDAIPIPASDMGVPRETAVFVQDTIWHTISVLYPDSLGWAFMTFSDEIALELAGGDMSLQQEGQAALVYPLTGYKTYFGEGLLLNYAGPGLLSSVDAYDYVGSVPTSISIVAGPYLCGDADASGGFDIDDIVYIVGYIFSGGPPPVPMNSGDVDCSGGVDIDDAVYLILHIFGIGPPPCDPDDDGTPDC